MKSVDLLQQLIMQLTAPLAAIPAIAVAAGAAILAGFLVYMHGRRQRRALHAEHVAQQTEQAAALTEVRQALAVKSQALADLEWQHRELEKSQRYQLEQGQKREQQSAVLCRELETKLEAVTRRREEDLAERDRRHAEQLALLEQSRERLTRDFENLANRIFEEKTQQFSKVSSESIDALLKPFREQIHSFEKRVNDVHDASITKHSALQAEIGKIVELGARMGEDALNLTNALKGNKKIQGDWGELQLEFLLQDAGLRKGIEYDCQTSLKNEEGQHFRPDFILNLPERKHIVLDSKVSLNSYIEAVSAESDEQRDQALDRLVLAFRRHFNSLSAKNYPKLRGLQSTELVFMFVPTEPAYLAAAQRAPTLFREAYQAGVAVVTPSTLMACLRIVAHLWTIDKQNQNTMALAAQAAKVHDKLRIFLERMERLGQQINTVQKSYDQAWSGVKDGQGSLVKQVDRFRDMGVPIVKSLPRNATDSAEDPT
ncbi:DNA recombination protein RmuC [Allohahella sp. A8]|uniref:DNA recombination protein RmuC n=1 Tax=Allohahella sp. A8 TaxID=3141461 RepID=UPI003A803FBB